MSEAVSFYFDFSSPYGYLASERIDTLFADLGRSVIWKPILIGAMFAETGAKPLLGIPYKGDYARTDILRAARRFSIPFVLPQPFPFAGVAASRIFYWCHDQDPVKAKGVATALFRRAFAQGVAPTAAQEVAGIAGAEGFDEKAALAALQDAEVKARLREEVDAAKAAGVFGSPFIVVNGEPFWGHDRLEDALAWAKTGGW